ncbi:MAG: flagellar protein FlgN [Mobiluncus porci]|uniref:Flagellar protein FlgN n=1 Tax=Mobiluncus porci TaxID=2652278 RepID=A0A7K0K3I3_9ACTO|nr:MULTISPECIES: flagellar protein FlgN [Mobiluncus]MCI6584691.1 flagellar protein FlgN [Mobiluncus sp.]MDD7541002.1 flagellar protein FlgN [Mobiluncus porci]MDY5748177.1 flagellar protein FlgN [Mobiluncus porci]MST49989.1 flagellar protein FlgN [Mobiluncus porci]
MSLDALSRQLWKQRETLEVMLFKLEEERLITSTGSSRWLPRATRELESVIAQAQTIELERSMESEAAAVELGLPPEASLKEIAAAAEEPWQTLLTQHREALIQLTTEIADVSKANQEVLSSLQRATQETLMSMQGGADTYGEDGSVKSYDSGSSLLDQAI